jgi:hypothetical protein
MKKNNKPNPLKFFNDNRAKAYKQAGGQMAQYKKALKKAGNGEETGLGNSGPELGPGGPQPNMGNPLSLNAALGNFNLGYDTNVSNTGLTNNRFSAGYSNPKIGLDINAGYDPARKNFSGGIDYNTTIGKNKTPLRLGVTYNRKNGGALKSKKK